jgi:protein-disulfide isomerase
MKIKIKAKEIGVWVGVMLVFAAISWGLINIINTKPPSKETEPVAQIQTPAEVSENDIILGSIERARVILIEYTDFQCPACKVYAENVKKLSKDFGDDLLIVHRFLPLTSIHKNAVTSAQAAYAAFKQNKFWEMDELLYENQDSWANTDNPLSIFTDYAKKFNLNIDQFTNDYTAQSTKEFIDAQRNEGISIGITYTPSFFVNGKIVEVSPDYETFKQIIKNALNAD